MADFDEQSETRDLFLTILRDVQSVIRPKKEKNRGEAHVSGGESHVSGGGESHVSGGGASGGGGESHGSGAVAAHGNGDGSGAVIGASGASHTTDEVNSSAAAARDAGHLPPDTNRSSGESMQSQDHSPTAKNKREADATEQKNSWLDKIGGLGGLLAIGITLAMAAVIAEKSLESYINCENAAITITSINPTPRGFSWMPQWTWLINLFPKPKTVDIKWTADNSYTPLAGSDSWDITGTGTIMDKTGVPIKSVDGKTVQCICGQDDCSNVQSKTGGSAQANCDYADRLNKAVDDTASDFASTVGKLMTSLGTGLMSALPIILFVLAAFFLFSVLKS